MDSGGGGSAEVMVYSLGWGMGEPERRGADRKRGQPAPVAVVHTPLSPDEGHEVDVLPLHNQVTIIPHWNSTITENVFFYRRF